MQLHPSPLLLCSVQLTLAGSHLSLADSPATNATPPTAGQKWAATWATGLSGTYADPTYLINGRVAALNYALPNPTTDGASNQTVRLITKPDLWGSVMRFKLSNVFGTKPVTFGQVGVGLQAYGANLVPGTSTPLTFNGGASSVTIPAGQEVFSDPVALAFVASPTNPAVQGRNLAVSCYVSGTSGPITQHANGFGTSYLAAQGSGNHALDLDDSAYPYSMQNLFFVAEIDVVAPTGSRVLVGRGSSTTDGYFSTMDGHDRYLDQMSRRLHATYGTHVSVVNTGIGGDTASTPMPGRQFIAQNQQQRLDREVIGISGVTDSIFYVGVNDQTVGGQQAPATIAAYRTISQRLRAANVTYIQATITSTVGEAGLGGSPAGLANYAAINQFIRSNDGTFDSVADFQTATADPTKGDINADTAPLYPQYAAHSSGNPAPDYIHVGRAGMQAESTTLNLSFFAGPGH